MHKILFLKFVNVLLIVLAENEIIWLPVIPVIVKQRITATFHTEAAGNRKCACVIDVHKPHPGG